MTVHVDDQDLIRKLIVVALAAYEYTEYGHGEDVRLDALCGACERISDRELVNLRTIHALAQETA